MHLVAIFLYKDVNYIDSYFLFKDGYDWHMRTSLILLIMK